MTTTRYTRLQRAQHQTSRSQAQTHHSKTEQLDAAHRQGMRAGQPKGSTSTPTTPPPRPDEQAEQPRSRKPGKDHHGR